MKFVSKEVKNLTLLPPFWTVFSIQVVILSKRLLTSFLTTTLGYGCIWTVVLILAKHAPHSKNDISEDSEVNNCLEKYILLALWRMRSRLQVFLRPSKIESDLITSHENSLTTKYSFKMSNFGLLWRWLKSKLFGVTCSFKERCMRARDKYSYSTVLYKIDMAPWTIVMAKHYDYGTVFEVYIWMTLRKTCSLTATFSNTLHKNI